MEELYKKISITIVLYGETINVISRCLEKLKNFKIIIVDNSGNENLKKKINDKFYVYKYIKNKKNVGFSKAANQAINLSDTEFILNLEADCLIDCDDIIKLFNSYKKYENCFMVTPTFYDENKNLSYNGGPLPERNIPMQILKAQGDVCIETPLTAAILFKKKDFIELGMFDEDFFIYFPDFEVSRRIKILKKSIIQVFDAQAYHVMGTLKIKNNLKRIFFRNYFFTLDELIYYYKANNYKSKYLQLKKKIPSLILKTLLSLLFFKFYKAVEYFSRILAYYNFKKKIK